MKTVNHGGVRLDACGGCGGWWVDRGVLDGFAAEQGQAAVQIVAGEPTSIACPACPGQKLHSATIDSVTVEQCRECHSVFLDHDELRRVAKREPKKTVMTSYIKPRRYSFPEFIIDIASVSAFPDLFDLFD